MPSSAAFARRTRRRSARRPAASPIGIRRGGLGVRVDSGAYQGYRIPPNSDSLIGKLIVAGKTRNECLMRLRRCLSEFVIDGIETTIPLFTELVRHPDIANGTYDIHWLEKHLGMKS